MSIRYKQKFHSVGQGLFYSSSLSNGNMTANIVFDCGSDNIDSINGEVEEYVQTVQEIDLLIISHLHYDHVSGLDELLKNVKVKTVVLPYLFPFERLLLQFVNGTKLQWYIDFLENPYTWLKEKNIEKIIIIKQQDDGSDPIVFQDIQVKDNNQIFVQLGDIDEQIKSEIENTEHINYELNNKVSIYTDNGYIQISNLVFAFFNYKIKDSAKIKAFISKLKITDNKSALEALKNKANRTELEDAYKILSSDLNITSLAVYQGFILPLNQSKDKYIIETQDISPYDLLYCRDCNCIIDGHFHGYSNKCKYRIYVDYYRYMNKLHGNHKMIGTLLLGDIKLDYKASKGKELYTYFKKLLQSVKYIQLSHHGANNGWNDFLINEISPNCLYIASHATKNKYDHPDKSVLIKLAENHRRYISVTENSVYDNNVSFYFVQTDPEVFL